MKTTLDQIADTMSDREIAREHPEIPGWGIDANPDNDPTYPIKHYTGADHQRLDYPRHPQQRQTIEVYLRATYAFLLSHKSQTP